MSRPLYAAAVPPQPGSAGASGQADGRRRLFPLVWLTLGLVIGPLVLSRTAGLPRLPSELPYWQTIVATLNRPEIPPEAALYVLSTAAWLLWLWLAGTTALRIVLAAADTLTRGASWVHALRSASDRITLPVVRRAVDGALVASVLVTVAGRATPVAAAADPAPALVTALAQTAAPIAEPEDVSHPSPARQQQSADATIQETDREYTVREGDTLWQIAEKHYGTGEAYKRIVAANTGRVMADGRRFTYEGVIHPGWTLLIPGVSAGETNGDTESEHVHIVAEGETLRSIAAQRLGTEERWQELFALNREVARMPDGRTLTHEDLIWPGLPLRLPGSASQTSEAIAPEAPQAAAPADGHTGALLAKAAETIEAAEPEGETQIEEVAGDWQAAAPHDALEVLDPSSAAAGEAVEPVPVLEHEPVLAGADTGLDPVAGTPAFMEVRLEPVHVGAAGGEGPDDAGSRRVATAAIAGAAGLAAFGVAGARRRFRRSLAEPPVDQEAELGAGIAVVDGFAQAELERSFVHRVHAGEVEPAVLIAGQVERLLREHGIRGAAPVTILQGRSLFGLTASVTLRLDSAQASRLPAVAAAIGRSFGSTGTAEITADGDVLLRLARIRPIRLLSPDAAVLRPDRDGHQPSDHTGGPDVPPLWLPLGLTPTGAVLYANWRELGHVLAAGTGGSAETVLVSLAVALAARTPPDALHFVPVCGSELLLHALRTLPHSHVLQTQRAATDPASFNRDGDETLGEAATEGAAAMLHQLYGELLRRMRGGEGSAADSTGKELPMPALVAVVGELAELDSDGPAADAIEALAIHGPAYGIHLLAAATHAGAVPDYLLARFDTRLVFQMPTEEESIVLLGQPDAADLGGGGNVLARLGGRAPVRLRGFRVPPEQLERLGDRLRQQYGYPTSDEMTTGIAPRADDDGMPLEHTVVQDDLPGVVARVVTPRTTAAGNIAETSDEVVAADTTARGTMALPGREAVTVEMSSSPPTTPANGHMGDGPAHHEQRNGTASSDDTARQSTPSTPLRVLCLGPLEILGDGRPVGVESGAGAQYRAREVLAFMAAQPGGTTTRERLLTALWPDADYQRGSKRLTVALVRVRQWLAEHVPGLDDTGSLIVKCARDGTCSLDTRVVWADAQEFLSLIRTAATPPPEQAKEAYARARALYRGELLTKAPYLWLDERGDDGLTLREHYRERYRRATLELARLYRESGDVPLAIPLYKDLLRAEPTLEDVVRELFHCYHQMGDLKALVLEERRLRQAIQELMADPDDPDDDPSGYEPEPRTMQLFEELVADLQQRAGTRAAAARAREQVAAG